MFRWRTNCSLKAEAGRLIARGREAVVALGRVLAENKEIAVLIEGHTDNVPYGGSGNISDNWDLSTKRATAIVSILN